MMKKRCLIGSKYTEEIKELNDLGIETILLPLNKNLDEEINNHADILSFKLNNDKLIIDSNAVGEINSKLKEYECIACCNISSPYPADVKLNIAKIGNRIICNTKYVSEIVMQYAEKNNQEIVHTAQGYTKCSLCILSDNAVITEDVSLSSLLKKYQIDVLTIKPGYVTLSDKHFGFIGGAACMISDKEMYFSGNISLHPDYCKIIEFLNKYGVKPVFNKNRVLRDFGGLIMLD